MLAWYEAVTFAAPAPGREPMASNTETSSKTSNILLP
eukprot:COSAG04_NODE_8891_length_920_cov_1.512789_1_plen_36_part_10